jgi:hypothetical protein
MIEQLRNRRLFLATHSSLPTHAPVHAWIE